MTVSSVIPVNNYTGNSSVKKFDFDFLIENTNELVVQHTDKNGIVSVLSEGTDYSVNETGNPNGSYITFPLNGSSYDVLKPDETISLILDLTIKQEAEFGNSLYFDLHILERTFDYIVRILQIFAGKFERCLKVNEGAKITPDELFNEIKESAVKSVSSAAGAEESENKALLYYNSTKSVAEEAIAEIGTDNTRGLRGDAVSSIISAKNESLNAINLTGAENAGYVNIAKDNALNDINSFRDETLNAVNSAGTSALSQITPYVSLAKDWANKTDGTVDGEEYSAKYYASLSHRNSAVSYEQLRSVISYLNDGFLRTDAEGFISVYSGKHSTFDLSKFEILGSPDITKDGIVSGFANTAYLQPGVQTFDVTKPWEIKGTVVTGLIDGSEQGLLSYSDKLWVRITPSKSFGFAFTGNTETSEHRINGQSEVSGNTKYDYVFGWNGAKYYLDIYTENSLFEHLEYVSSIPAKISDVYPYLIYGNFAANRTKFWKGQIDLKKFSVKSNGITVFSGNKTGVDDYVIDGEIIEIPYTESKTGSKIVDVVYRDRVQDVYEQQGYAPYYTIDEENKNFTLPPGEIYGMIEKVKAASTVDIYRSGNTQVWKYKDGRLIMTGRYEWQMTSSDIPFVQPVLSANGTPGGSAFAALSSSPFAEFAAYKVFDGNTSTFFEGNATDPCYVGFYNPQALKVTSLLITNGTDATRNTTNYAIDASNDGSSWVEILTGTSPVSGEGSSFNINLSSNNQYYKYYRLRSLGIKYGWIVTKISITAVYQGTATAAINRIVLPQTFADNAYGFIFSGCGGSVSNVYVSENGQNASYVDMEGTAESGTYLNWQAIGRWK